jgi:hypothetical protein
MEGPFTSYEDAHKLIQNFSRILSGRNHLGETDATGIIILKWISRICSEGMDWILLVRIMCLLGSREH